MEHYSREEFELLIALTREHGYWAEEMVKALADPDPWISWTDHRMKVKPDWFAWGALLAPIVNMPLFINDTQKNLYGSMDILSFIAIIARWRLRIGK